MDSLISSGALCDSGPSGSNDLSGVHDGQDGGEMLGEVGDGHFTTAPICLVLSDDVQRTFQTGDPLIVGTSMEDIQTFFQKVISEAQVGMEHSGHKGPGNEGGRYSHASRTARTIDPNEYPSCKPERYPVPHYPIPRTSKPKKYRSSNEEEEADRCEIPLDAIRLYLKDKQYFPGWGANSKRNLRKRCEDFKLENGILMYRTRKGKHVQCVEDRAERMRLLWQQHSIDHRRRDRLFHALKDKYYWKGMLSDINTMLASCEYCARVRQEKELQESRKEPVPEKPKIVKKRTSKITLESKIFQSKKDDFLSPSGSNTM